MWRPFAVMFATVGMLACGRGPAAVPPAPTTHTVTMEAVRFTPETLTVRAGDTVVWVNKDLFAHTATTPGPGFDSKEIAAGQSWSTRLPTAGTFPYVCSFHPTMKAVVQVQ